jgi:hypothetical protein
MRRLLMLTVIALATACGGRKQPAVSRDQLTNSEAVKVLRDDHSPYRVIYYPPVDLTKKPAS